LTLIFSRFHEHVQNETEQSGVKKKAESLWETFGGRDPTTDETAHGLECHGVE
jgi:hypothetical protein